MSVGNICAIPNIVGGVCGQFKPLTKHCFCLNAAYALPIVRKVLAGSFQPFLCFRFPPSKRNRFRENCGRNIAGQEVPILTFLVHFRNRRSLLWRNIRKNAASNTPTPTRPSEDCCTPNWSVAEDITFFRALVLPDPPSPPGYESVKIINPSQLQSPSATIACTYFMS